MAKLDPSKITAQQRKRLERLSKVVDNGQFAILEHLFDIEERFEGKMSEIESKIPNLDSITAAIKGKDGADGREGKDGRDGRDGNDGGDYILTESDRSEIARGIRVPIVRQIVEKRTETVIKELPVVRETIIKEPLAVKFSPQEVRDLLELLSGDDRLDAKALRGLDEYLRLNPPNGPMLHPVALGNLPDVSVVGVLAGQVLTWNGTYWYAGDQSSSAGFQLPLTGAVDGVNATYTWKTAPNAIVVDGAALQKSEQGDLNTVNWTGMATTVMLVAPTQSIFAVA